MHAEKKNQEDKQSNAQKKVNDKRKKISVNW